MSVQGFRHELKTQISPLDREVLLRRLHTFARCDPHTADGFYTIRSLYFDTPRDKALREKLDGVDRREKFRLRCYNADFTRISLEKKCKIRGLSRKTSCLLTQEECQRLLSGDTRWMSRDEQQLVRELALKCTLQGLKPKTLVDYRREPYVYAPGNVRITIDSQIRTGLYDTDFFQPAAPFLAGEENPMILEVKYDAFLPDLVDWAVRPIFRAQSAFSKYAHCRRFG